MSLGGYSLPFLFAKITDIGLVTFYFLTAGLISSVILDKLFKFEDKIENDKKSSLQLFGEIFLQVFAIGVTYYVLRNIVERIPTPVEGIGGFRHERLKELHGHSILGASMIYFSKTLGEKINILISRLLNNPVSDDKKPYEIE